MTATAIYVILYLILVFSVYVLTKGPPIMIDRIAVYDYESTGIQKDYDQVIQFAGAYADKDLNLIEGSELNILCKLRRDVVPHPQSFMIHRADIDEINKSGVSEFEMARIVNNFFTKHPNTAVSGYNTISFDDEMTRRMNYRCLRDPYVHEWKDNNIRLDFFKLVQMAYVFTPSIMEWAYKDDGGVSLKLENLTAVNGLEHGQAHDALSDVRATLSIGKLLRDRNPNLWNYFLSLADKKAVKDTLLKQEPLIMASTTFGRDRHYCSAVLPIVQELNNANGFIAIDLNQDLDVLFSLSAEEIGTYMFTPRVELPENSPTIPCVRIASNKGPAIVPAAKYLTAEFADRTEIDKGLVEHNLNRIKSDPLLQARIQKAFAGEMSPSADIYGALYSGGFQTRDDQREQEKFHFVTDKGPIQLVADSVAEKLNKFNNPARVFELAVRAKWNNFFHDIISQETPSELDPLELVYYAKHLNNMLYGKGEDGNLTVEKYHEAIREMRMTNPFDEEDHAMIEKVSAHVSTIQKSAKQITAMATKPEIIASARERLHLIPEELQKSLSQWIDERAPSQSNEGPGW